MSMWLKIKGWTFCIMLFLTSFVGAVVFGGFFMPIHFISPMLYRHIFDAAIGTWEWQVAGLLEKWLGLNVIITGDRMRGAGEQSLIIMNHRTCLDWLYFWSVLIRQSGVSTEKIVLKSPLKHIPGAGWAMQTSGFMFLRRRWDSDQTYLTKILQYFKSLNYPTQILLFPEGTDFNEKSKARSDAYAKKVGLGSYKNLLQPRTTGFAYFVSKLKQDWPDAAVYDITVGYPDSPPFPQTERDLLAGQFASSVHYDIKRYSIRDIPDESEAINQWCQERWNDKEKRLHEFRADGSFLNSRNVESIPSSRSLSNGTSTGVEASGSSQGYVDLRLYLAVIAWFFCVVFFITLLFWSSVARWLALIHIVIFIVLDVWYGGFELFQAWYYSLRVPATA